MKTTENSGLKQLGMLSENNAWDPIAVEFENSQLRLQNEAALKSLRETMDSLLKEREANDMLRARLVSIEESLFWRSTGFARNFLSRHPSLKQNLRRFLKLAVWTVRLKLLSHLRQYARATQIHKVYARRAVKLVKWTLKGELVHRLRDYRRMHQIRRMALSPDRNKAGFYNGLLEWDIFTRIMSFSAEHGSFRLVIALNFYADGGAESVAANYARYRARKGDGAVLLLITDDGPRRPLPELPENVLVIDLADTLPAGSDNLKRENTTFQILRFLEPQCFHIVNSCIAWQMLRRIPKDFFNTTKMVGSVFALQFSEQNPSQIIGFGVTYLPESADKLSAIATDNASFAREAPKLLSIEEAAPKFMIVYNPCKLEAIIGKEAALSMLAKRSKARAASDKLLITWAGRLDREKRVELLMQIAEQTADFCTFQIFGGSVVDGNYETALKRHSNILMRGPFKSPLEWDKPNPGHAFLFTSVWEGMPNSLIEAAYLGFPIIATAVGGVPELITPETGWPIQPHADAAPYVAVLRAIHEGTLDVRPKVRALIELVFKRHTQAAFEEGMANIPGYSSQ